jgi:type I restriction enzyme S subunit
MSQSMRSLDQTEHSNLRCLGDVLEFVRNGFTVKQKETLKGLPITRIETISHGVIDCTRVGFADLEERDCKDWFLEKGDILLSHINSIPHIGKCALYRGEPEKLVHGMNLLCLRSKREVIDPEYLVHYFRTRRFKIDLLRYVNPAVNQASVSITNLVKVLIPVPPLPEQRRIATILDKADAIRRKRRQAIDLMNDFLRSVFLEMFGDLTSNSKSWSQMQIQELAEVTGGVQVSSKRSTNPIEVPYLRVANVYRDLLHLDEIKSIRVTQQELSRCLLKEGDILSVEGHGNPDEIGRTAVWDGSINPCIHQNHLIRIRANSKLVLPVYLSAFINSPEGKRQFFRLGKTTSGLNTINITNVREAVIAVPPLSKQKEYISVVDACSKAKARMKSSDLFSEELFASVTNQLFATPSGDR